MLSHFATSFLFIDPTQSTVQFAAVVEPPSFLHVKGQCFPAGLPNPFQQRIEILSGAVSVVKIPVPDDDPSLHGIQFIFLAEPCSELAEGCHLCPGGLCQIEIPCQADAHRGLVMPQGMCSHEAGPSSLLNHPVLADQIMIADPCPFHRSLMKAVDFLRSRVFVRREACMVNDKEVG